MTTGCVRTVYDTCKKIFPLNSLTKYEEKFENNSISFTGSSLQPDYIHPWMHTSLATWC